MILSIAQCVWNLTKEFWYLLSFSYPTTNGFWVEFWVGMKVGHTCITYFAKSKTGPQGDASHTLWSRRTSVWNFHNVPNSKYFWYSLNHDSLSWDVCLYLKVWAIFISFFSFLHALWHAFFLSHAFWHGYIFFLFLSFFYSPYFSF